MRDDKLLRMAEEWARRNPPGRPYDALLGWLAMGALIAFVIGVS